MILKVPKINNQRSRYHCMHLLITKVIAQARKTINRYLLNAIGIEVYIIRKKDYCYKHPPRKHYCVNLWMIRGTFVSKN